MFVTYLAVFGRLVVFGAARLRAFSTANGVVTRQMPTRKPTKKARSREEFQQIVLETARQLFLEKGVSRASMADLGRVLGVSKPTVYEAFRSKQQLMDAVFDAVADDVDMGWLSSAVVKPPPFNEFLDETAEAYKRILSSPRSVQAFQLLIQEGGHQVGLTDAFVKKLTLPATQAGRKVIAAAIRSGQCAPLDTVVVQKMVDAPLMHVLVDRTLFGKHGMSDGIVNTYIDNSFSALKTLLCNGRAG